MTIHQTDSNGGVIVTDWYANPQAPGERVKVSVFILDQDLRADAVRVSAVRQENKGGTWLDAPVRAGTVQKLEETILAKARDGHKGHQIVRGGDTVSELLLRLGGRRRPRHVR